MADLSGRTIKGYALRECIGSGGFGAVYRAHQPAVNRDVAVKVILAQHADNPDFIRRFEAEAQVVARLEHPHIVPLYDYWREPGGAYLVMRWLPTSLQQALVAGSWPLDAIGRLLTQAASALQAAHRHGVVHRDVKPANILLDEDRNAYLADFGVAKILGLSAQHTEEGALVGSPAYSAPEQIRSEPVTPQTDLYSLGLVLYELLTGTPPYPEATTPTALIYKHLNEPLPSVKQARPDLPLALDTVVQTATAKEPSARYPDALRMATAYNALLEAPRRLAAQPLAEPLTERELEILRLMVADLDNNQIAERLVLTLGTVRWYVKQICGKLDVHSRAQAVERARELRLTDARLSDSLVRAVSELPETPEAVTVREIPPKVMPSAPLENPYKGLRAFQEADAPDFFGREALVQHLLDRLAEDHPLARFLAVVGPSGSGKSSVVRAGLIPALRAGRLPGSERWFLTDMLPGTHPFEELEAALNRIAARAGAPLLTLLREDERGLARAVKHILPTEGGDVLLVIDQFEELFTLLDSEAERTCFLDNIRATVSDPRAHVRVIVTLRADFYDRPLMYGPFGELMRERTAVILPLNADELRQAVTGPAERISLAVDSAFIQAVVSEVAAQPGALPLFQYALTEAFEAQQNHTLTLHAYQAIGGLTGALARRADDVYDGLSENEQAASRQFFLRLVTLGEGVEDTRRRVQHSELLALGDAEAMQSAIDAFDRARLLSFDRDPISRGPTVEVAHEAILREWQRLRFWLDESHHDIRQQRLLAAAAAEWQQAAGDRSYLLTGSRLEQAAGWAAETKLALTRQERSFLVTSMAERERQETDEIERQARELALQKRAANRLRYMVAGLAIFLVAALVLTVLALDARSTAQKQRDKAEREAAVSHSLVLANAAQREFDNGITDLALALALEAVSIEQPPSEAIKTLTSVAYGPGLRAILTGHPHTVRAVAFSPDGQWALSGSCAELSNAQCTDGELILWDLQSKTMLRRFGGRDSVGHTDWVMSIAFVAHNTALSGSKDGTIILWDLETGQPIRSFQGHTAGVNRVVCHPDGQTFLSASDDTTIILWNIAAGESIQHFVGHSAAVNSVAFSPDGQQFASASDDTSIILWDIASSVAVRTITGHTSRVSDLAFMPEASSTLFSTSYDLTIRSWNTQNGQETYQYSFGAKSDCLAITPDSHYVAMCVDFPIRLLDIETYQDPYRLISSPSAKLSVAISPDGGQVMAGAEDGSVYIWNLSIQPEIRRFEADDTRLSNVAVSPDGQRILTATTGGEVIVWDVRQGTEIRRFAHYDGLPAYFSFSPDGQQALVLAGDVFRGANSGWIGLWDVDTGEEVFRLEGHRFYPRSVAFSPDGRQAITSSMSYPCLPTDVVCGEMIQWDLTTGEEIRRFALDERMDITSIDFSADGTHILTGTNLPVSKAVLWDIATGEPIREYKAEGGIAMFRAVFSPDEKAVLGAEGNGILYLWDIETGAPLRRYVGHEDYLTWVDISPDGRYMISADASGSIILWNFSTGQELRRMKVPADVTTVSFTPDGQTAFSAPYTGTSVIQWEVVDQPLERLLAWAHENRYVRDFTCEERAQYDIPPLCETDAR